MAEKISFEKAMLRLEDIVKTLEKGDASLEAALALFEEGTALIHGCNKQLDEAEQKIVKLVKGPDGTPIETEFESHE